MSRAIFVTGTDTGVGKTLVTAGILRWLRKQGIDAVPLKPVQTGVELRDGRLSAPDLEFCLAAAGIHPPLSETQLMAPYLYQPACSPHLAGRLAHHYPQLYHIKDCADKLLQNHQAVIIESAGGIMVPLNEDATTLDLMKMLGYPVVLVARFGLGTINHTLLSIRVLKASRIRLMGVVFNHTERPRDEEQFIEEDNPKAIARFDKVTVLGKIRFLDNPETNTEETWKHFEEDVTGLRIILRELGE